MWITTLHESVNLMRDTARSLNNIGHRLHYVTPNSPAAEDLFELSRQLNLQAEALEKAGGNKLANDLENAQAMSQGLLKATIAGRLMGEASPEQKKALVELVKGE